MNLTLVCRHVSQKYNLIDTIDGSNLRGKREWFQFKSRVRNILLDPFLVHRFNYNLIPRDRLRKRIERMYKEGLCDTLFQRA